MPIDEIQDVSVLISADGTATSRPDLHWTEHWHGDEGLLVYPQADKTIIVDGGKATDAARSTVLTIAKRMTAPFEIMPGSHAPKWCKRANVEFWGLYQALKAGLMQPVNEYVYHGTRLSSLQCIGVHGLVVRSADEGETWAHVDRELDAWCEGKLFLTLDSQMAETYALEKYPSCEIVTLRVATRELETMFHDSMGSGEDIYVLHGVPSASMDVLISGEWKPLDDMLCIAMVGMPSPKV